MDKREIHDHKTGSENDLDIIVADEPGQGNANHIYNIVKKDVPSVLCRIHFQDGPIKENGINGVTNESLLAIVADRLRGFQSGDYRCKENACALTHIEESIMWLQKRTFDRTRRGVEGTNKH